MKRLLLALPFSVIAFAGTTQSAFAFAFDPSRDELLIGTFIAAVIAMGVLGVIYAALAALGAYRTPDVYIPDHAHDHRYADHH